MKWTFGGQKTYPITAKMPIVSTLVLGCVTRLGFEGKKVV